MTSINGTVQYFPPSLLQNVEMFQQLPNLKIIQLLKSNAITGKSLFLFSGYNFL